MDLQYNEQKQMLPKLSKHITHLQFMEVFPISVVNIQLYFRIYYCSKCDWPTFASGQYIWNATENFLYFINRICDNPIYLIFYIEYGNLINCVYVEFEFQFGTSTYIASLHVRDIKCFSCFNPRNVTNKMNFSIIICIC